ncbi:ParB/Srx family N-terminal domain-containing protein [Myroides pelagicus]|uniref:ParB/Srx family N-terminal domain-containing protein n=1 Tax=Myroides pelagicus TaxID=270914 RepID=UPI002DB72AA1|nr:ParB/Srx family N-terminal domain-containing protein [Myroides pelagicus]MEC4114618.1 ParB/Srx family N-terminal domain-containing protein [Myroides pelagicus]
MINYSSWPRKKISTTTLRLDLNNPRLSETTKKLSQNEIIEYLLENEKVYELAINIATTGYFLNEQPIIVKEGGKYHVLEGNRRVTACKILINPDLITNSTKKARIKNLVKNFDINTILKLECIISPTREDADVMIVNRHTSGSSVEKWDKTKQDRFLYNRFIQGETVEQMADKFPLSKNDIREALKRYNVYKELSNLDLPELIKNSLLNETSFKMTNVERVYQSKDGLDFMGFEFNENDFSLIKKLPKEEFEKRMSKIAIDVIEDRINSRKLNTESDKKKYLQQLWDSGEFDTTITPNISYNIPAEIEEAKERKEKKTTDNIEDIKPVRSRPTLTKLMAANTHLNTGIPRIDDIFEELKSLNIKKNPNAVAVLFRSYLDMLTYQFLKKTKGLDGLNAQILEKQVTENEKRFQKIKKSLSKLDSTILERNDESDLKKALGIDAIERSKLVPSLKYMLDYISQSTTLITDNKLRQALQGYVRNDLKELGHNDFNLLVHNEYYKADSEELKKVWCQMLPVLEYLVSQLK